MQRARAADFEWADAVFVSGMHIQAAEIHDICRRAKAHGKVTVLGGPSVSAAPEKYPDYDYLHIGELGQATDFLIARIDAASATPPWQIRYVGAKRLAMTDFPYPAYNLVQLDKYLLGTLQFSSGCPYLCEFCDIPNLYGRQPRMKTPQQLIGELDFILSQKSNVLFLRPYDEVVATWRRCIEYAYDPERLYARFIHQIEATYANRLVTPGAARLTPSNLKRGLTLVANLLVRVGFLADYRRPFWRMAWQAVKRGQIEALFGVGFIAYHLIEFSREALRGQQNASFYSTRASTRARETIDMSA